MNADRTELIKLRVSLARVAQAAGVGLFAVGVDDHAPYEILHRAAEGRERGWNELAALVSVRVEQARRRQEEARAEAKAVEARDAALRG
jgi:hypothetical protein